MGKRPSLAKTTRPILGGIYPRRRLFRVLDHARKRPLIYVAGPPGAGKTSLVASYLEHRKLSGLWYQVDDADADVATFFYYMRLAATHAAPRHRKPLPLLTPEYRLGLATFTRRYFQELYSRLKAPFVLVFDNYQEASVDSPIHDVIRDGVAELPPGGHVILISRHAPPPTLARLRANQTMEVLGWEELRLRPEESAAIARLQGQGRVSRDTLRRLHEQTEGWAAGLVLLLEHARRESEAPRAVTAGGREAVFDYFAGEIFKKTDHATQDFLLHTAFLPKMTVGMAEHMTGLAEAGHVLADLNRKNYFTLKHPESEFVYQYHPLLREFLLARAEQVLSPVKITRLPKRAATILEKSGQLEEAVVLFRQAGDWAGMVRVILSQAPLLLAQGRNQTLEEWLGWLPKEVIDETPWLLYWRGTGCLPFDLRRSRDDFARAFTRFGVQGDQEGLFLAWAGVVETYIYEWGDYRPLDHWIERLEELVECFPQFPSPEAEARVACGMFTALMYRQPDHPRLAVWEERARNIAMSGSDIHLRVMIGNHLLLYYIWWTGDLAKATLLANTLRAAMGTAGVAALTRIAWYAIEAAYCWMTARNDRCVKAVNDGIILAQKTGIRMWDFMLCAQGVYGTLTQGDLTSAEGFLGRMMAAMNPARRLDVCHYHFLSAWHALYRHDLAAAVEHAKMALSMAEKSGAPFARAYCHMGLAQVLFESGRRQEASAHLGESRRISALMKSKAVEYLCFLVEARDALDHPDAESALRAVRGFFTLGREQNFVNHAWWRPDIMARLCAEAIEHGIEVEYVQTLIRTRTLLPEDPPVHIEHWPWPIKIYTLGRFALLKDGAPLPVGARAQRRPLELLKALIALGGRDIPEEQLADLLWPEAEGDAAHRAFDTTLHRLRHLLGQEKALLLREGRLTLDPRLCWVDARAFERLLDQVEAVGKVDTDRALALAEKALCLYQGLFLGAGAREPWAISLRERLRGKFLRQVGHLGTHWEQAGEWTKGVNCYQRGLEVDDLAEEFYQRLMTCYQRLGRRAEALAVYQRCRTILATVLGVEPAPATEAIYQALLNS